MQGASGKEHRANRAKKIVQQSRRERGVTGLVPPTVMLRWNACARPDNRAASGRRAAALTDTDKHFMPLMPIILEKSRVSMAFTGGLRLLGYRNVLFWPRLKQIQKNLKNNV